jgi:tetratricopeptide (TPR) repeat protein
MHQAIVIGAVVDAPGAKCDTFTPMERMTIMLRKTSAALTIAGVVFLAPSAEAAVTVLGNGLARVCFEVAEFGGNPRDGVATCSEALEQTALSMRDRSATLINRGILYSRLDHPEMALNDYNRGLSIDPDMGEGYVDRGAVYIVLRRYETALQDIDKGIEMNANRLQIAYYDRAIVHEALGNVRAAYDDYKKAAEIEPGFVLANEQLARFKVIRHQGDGT